MISIEVQELLFFIIERLSKNLTSVVIIDLKIQFIIYFILKTILNTIALIIYMYNRIHFLVAISIFSTKLLIDKSTQSIIGEIYYVGKC